MVVLRYRTAGLVENDAGSSASSSLGGFLVTAVVDEAALAQVVLSRSDGVGERGVFIMARGRHTHTTDTSTVLYCMSPAPQ